MRCLLHQACFYFCNADACFRQDLSSSFPQSTRLSICSKSSSHVMTPGVESGGMKPAQPEQFGYAPTSLHISSQRPASLFCNSARRLRSVASQACSSLFCTTWLLSRREAETLAVNIINIIERIMTSQIRLELRCSEF